MPGKVYFIGAGPGDLELLTVKGQRIIQEADLIIYTDSLVNPEVASLAKPGAQVERSAGMVLEDMIALMVTAANQGKTIARVHTGDPSIFGAVLEQAVALRKADVDYEIVPGVSSMFAAAAMLGAELTVPELAQTVIVTRMEGRTPVPPGEKLRDLAAHQATLVLFLSITLLGNVVRELQAGGYSKDTPIAVVYKATWPDQVVVSGTLEDIAEKAREARINSQSIIIVGKVLHPSVLEGEEDYRSKLYDENFTHSYRKGREPITKRANARARATKE